jgi:hypothetical protein
MNESIANLIFYAHEELKILIFRASRSSGLHYPSSGTATLISVATAIKGEVIWSLVNVK